MSALVELEQAARLHRAEDRWLAQCADRLRSAASPRSATTALVEPVETMIATTTETVR